MATEGDEVTTTPEAIEDRAQSTLGDKYVAVEEVDDSVRPPYYFARVVWKDNADAATIQGTAMDLAEAFMVQGVYNVGMSVMVDDPELGREIEGAAGVITFLEDNGSRSKSTGLASAGTAPTTSPIKTVSRGF